MTLIDLSLLSPNPGVGRILRMPKSVVCFCARFVRMNSTLGWLWAMAHSGRDTGEWLHMGSVPIY